MSIGKPSDSSDVRISEVGEESPDSLETPLLALLSYLSQRWDRLLRVGFYASSPSATLQGGPTAKFQKRVKSGVSKRNG